MSEHRHQARPSTSLRGEGDEVVLLARSRLAARMQAIRERSHELVEAISSDDRPRNAPAVRASTADRG
jgi:hypothetical protein